MTHLSENWFTSPLFDVEYKQYQVLGYVQKLEAHFEEKELFPYYDDLLRHIQNLETLTYAKRDFEKELPQNPMVYKQEELDIFKNESIQDLNEIIAFAERTFNRSRVKAERQLHLLLDKIQVSQLGLINPNALGGMVMISQNEVTRVYTYEHRLVYRPNTYYQHKDIRTQIAKIVPTDPDVYRLKWELLKSDHIQAGINTYHVSCDAQIPHFETVLPLVKNHILTHDLNQPH